jgi:hypothetical protein
MSEKPPTFVNELKNNPPLLLFVVVNALAFGIFAWVVLWLAWNDSRPPEHLRHLGGYSGVNEHESRGEDDLGVMSTRLTEDGLRWDADRGDSFMWDQTHELWEARGIDHVEFERLNGDR